MKTYRNIEIARQLITYPFRLAFLPFMAIFGLAFTDLTEEWDIKFYKKSLKELYRPLNEKVWPAKIDYPPFHN